MSIVQLTFVDGKAVVGNGTINYSPTPTTKTIPWTSPMMVNFSLSFSFPNPGGWAVQFQKMTPSATAAGFITLNESLLVTDITGTFTTWVNSDQIQLQLTKEAKTGKSTWVLQKGGDVRRGTFGMMPLE